MSHTSRTTTLAVKEETMTHTKRPSANTSSSQQHKPPWRLTTLGIVAKQLATDDLLGQGLLLRALGF